MALALEWESVFSRKDYKDTENWPMKIDTWQPKKKKKKKDMWPDQDKGPTKWREGPTCKTSVKAWSVKQIKIKRRSAPINYHPIGIGGAKMSYCYYGNLAPLILKSMLQACNGGGKKKKKISFWVIVHTHHCS